MLEGFKKLAYRHVLGHQRARRNPKHPKFPDFESSALSFTSHLPWGTRAMGDPTLRPKHNE